MATKYSDIVALRDMVSAYNIKDEGTGAWRTFIANDQFDDLLGHMLAAVCKRDISQHKALWVSGTYGSGKSHAGAVLKHLFCDPVDDIRCWLDREYVDARHTPLRDSVLAVREQKRLLPVNLYGQENIAHEQDLSFAVQTAVKSALRAVGIATDVRTDFDSYLAHTEQKPALWQLLIDSNAALRSVAPDLRKLRQLLADGDMDAMHRVKTALRQSQLTVRLPNADLCEWIFEVQEAVRQAPGGYSGLLIIWDEFTDPMRSNVGLAVLKVLQRIAEQMMQPENDSYFLFLSHTSALDSLGGEERKQTMGRYHNIAYNMETVSAFRIMSAKFTVQDHAAYTSLLARFGLRHIGLIRRFAVMSANPAQTKQDIAHLFPLHPATANLAAYYAREAGSSSRSVFDFLASDTVRAFLDNEAAFRSEDTITAEVLWDYVRPVFEAGGTRYEAVVQRYYAHHTEVEQLGEAATAVFKGVLLLNALHRLSPTESVTPNDDNIAMLFEGTPRAEHVAPTLAAFNKAGYIQQQPDGLWSIMFSSLPAEEVRKIKKDLLITTFHDASTVANFDWHAKTEAAKWLAGAFRPVSVEFMSLAANEYTVLNRMDAFLRKVAPYSVPLVILVGRTPQEVAALHAVASRAACAERLQGLCVAVSDMALGENDYQRFVDYMANSACAGRHALLDQQAASAKNAGLLVDAWLARIRNAAMTFYLNSDKMETTALRIAATINAAVAPRLFPSGPEGLAKVMAQQSATLWKKASAKSVVDTVLNFHTKDDIKGKLQSQAKLVEILLQDSVDDNLQWKPDCPDTHPLRTVSEAVRRVFSHTTKSQAFNLGDKLAFLAQPPYGLYETYAPMAMLAFALKPYAGKLFDTNGKPRTEKHLVDDVVDVFKAWEQGKSSPKLQRQFESKESGAVCKRLISVFGLRALGKYKDISSLTDARWAITHEYAERAGRPLWALKYVDDCTDALRRLVDDVVRVVAEADSAKNPQLMSRAAEGLKLYEFELKNLLRPAADNFRRGFARFALGIETLHLKAEETDEAMTWLRQHLESTVGLWTERQVEDSLKDWRLERLAEAQRKAREAEALRQKEQKEAEEKQRRERETAGVRAHEPAPAPRTVPVMKRAMAQAHIMPYATSSVLRDLLTRICQCADEATLDMLLAYKA